MSPLPNRSYRDLYTVENVYLCLISPHFKPEQYHYVTGFFTILHHLLKPVSKCRVMSRKQQKKKNIKKCESRVHMYFLPSNPQCWGEEDNDEI